MNTLRAFALCALGLEKVCSRELERLGLEVESRSPGRVFFKADPAGLFRANLCLRAAERVMIEAARFEARDFDALFEGIKEVAWEGFFAKEDKLVIERVRSRSSRLEAQTAIQSIVHKAIYEKLGSAYGISTMPETGYERSLRVYLEDDVCLVGLDTSGEALHRRGYRRHVAEAPLKETVAAASLLMAGWNRSLPLVDPFCGSGTILIEAALFALDIAPGLNRSFSLETMPLAPTAAFAEERALAKARIRSGEELRLFGSDRDPDVIEAAKANAVLAGVAEHISFSVAEAEGLLPPTEDVGILICNPPYGERLGDRPQAEELYRRLGPATGEESLAARFAGWGLGFVTNRLDFGDYFGRRAEAERKIVNGAEEQWFQWYPRGWEDKPERPPRLEEGERPRHEHGTRDRPGRSDRPRPPYRGQDERGDRGGYGERRERPSYGDRPRRDDRPSYGDRPRYGDRPDRPSREDRPAYGDRPRYGDRPERPSYGDRPRYGDRPDRPRDGDRPRREDRPSYGDRPRYGDRPERPPRRDDRPSYGDRPRYGERPERPASGDRPAYGEREERRPRRESYGGAHGGSGGRPEGASGGDRDEGVYWKKREDGGWEKARRPAASRPAYRDRDEGGDRPPRPRYEDRETRSDRPDRPYAPRPYAPRAEGEGDRAERPPRPRFEDRGDRSDRPDRPTRPYAPRPYAPRSGGEGERRDGPPRPRYGDRPDRPQRPRYGYGPRAPRGGRDEGRDGGERRDGPRDFRSFRGPEGGSIH